MKAFIDRVFKMKKQKKEIIKNEEITSEIKEQATEAAIEAIQVEAPKEAEVIYLKPNHFPDCTCFKCERWRNQNAK